MFGVVVVSIVAKLNDIVAVRPITHAVDDLRHAERTMLMVPPAWHDDPFCGIEWLTMVGLPFGEAPSQTTQRRIAGKNPSHEYAVGNLGELLVAS